MAVKTLPDIAGAGATVALTADRSLHATGWVQFVSTVGTTRIGDSNAAIGRGIPVGPGEGMFFPVPGGISQDMYVLADIYAYIPVGTTLSIAYLE